MTYYKVTAKDGRAFHGGSGKWPLPSGKRPGKFLTVKGEIRACSRGLHFCREDQLVEWLGPVVWEFEPRGEIVDAGNKLVCSKGRLVRKCDNWNERTARLFAIDCAARTLNREKRAGRTPDKRSYDALKVARRFANGEATSAELAAAWAAARAAAWDTARDTARDAAWAAAWAAAWNAAGAAAGAAAWAAERKWQTKRLMEYVEGRRS